MSGLINTQLRHDLLGTLLPSSHRHRKSLCLRGRRPSYRLDQDFQGRPGAIDEPQQPADSIGADQAVAKRRPVHMAYESDDDLFKAFLYVR